MWMQWLTKYAFFMLRVGGDWLGSRLSLPILVQHTTRISTATVAIVWCIIRFPKMHIVTKTE